MAKETNQYFPFKIKDVEPSIAAELLQNFPEEESGFVRVGPKGYFLSKNYASDAALYYNMSVRPSDVFVNSFPRTGTTLTQELIWLIENGFDYKKAADTRMDERFPLIEYRSFVLKIAKEKYKKSEEIQRACKATENLHNAPSPRFIKTHLPLSLLPPALADTARVVYVARDPRDVAVSFFHLYKPGLVLKYNGDLKTFWNYFINDLINYSPYFEHMKEGWEKRHHPNVLFLFYEELRRDLPGTIRKVAKFLKKPITDEQVAKLANHLQIDNFKKNKSVNFSLSRDSVLMVPDEMSFIRRGKVGGWRDYFDEEMTRQAEHWIAENLRGTDLRFPSMEEP